MVNGKPLVLVPGDFFPYVRQRIEAEFECLTIERADSLLVSPDDAARVRGIASMTRITAEFIDAFENLSIIAGFGVGYDGVDAAHAAARGIMVTNTPDVLSDEVADTTIGLILNTLRELPKAEAYLRAGRWVSGGSYPLTKLTLRGRTAGIFGLGRIGKAIALRLEAFGVEVRYHNRSKRSDVPWRWHESLLDLARNVDLLIAVVPGGGGTEKIVTAEVFSALGPNGVFINVGRGTSVDEPALIAALENRTIAAAGLDVFAAEPHVPQTLLDLPNACLLPHVASASMHTRGAMGDLLVDNLLAWFAGKPASTPVFETEHLNR